MIPELALKLHLFISDLLPKETLEDVKEIFLSSIFKAKKRFEEKSLSKMECWDSFSCYGFIYAGRIQETPEWDRERMLLLQTNWTACSYQFSLSPGPMGMTSGRGENAFPRVTLVLGQEFWNWETPSYTEATGKHAQPLLEKVVIFIILVKKKKKKSPLCSRGRYTISFVLYRHFLKGSPRGEKKKKSCHTHIVTPYHEELSPDKIDIGENGTFLWIPHIYKSNSLALYTPNDKKPSCLKKEFFFPDFKLWKYCIMRNIM